MSYVFVSLSKNVAPAADRHSAPCDAGVRHRGRFLGSPFNNSTRVQSLNEHRINTIHVDKINKTTYFSSLQPSLILTGGQTDKNLYKINISAKPRSVSTSSVSDVCKNKNNSSKEEELQ